MNPPKAVATLAVGLLAFGTGSAHSAEPTTAAANPQATPTTMATAPTPASSPAATPSGSKEITDADKDSCIENLNKTVRPENRARLATYCTRIQKLPPCASVEKRPIHHVDSLNDDPRGKRILVLGLIHGDEPLAGEMTLEWAERLQKITHRNSWRVVGMLNPDGLERKTRMNARGVDLNRNFPTKDWPEEAHKYWEKSGKSDPRRFPGEGPASEPETKCAIAHIKDFKPDFIVSIHTPYKVLDFDGPRMGFPRYKDLPWRALGNFPGSLGRYMWKDYQVPVLTVELGASMVDAAQLQDIVGSFAMEASRRSGTKTASMFDLL